MTRQDIVVIADVKKSFGKGTNRKLAVRGISFGIKAGECLGLLGENGAGKSTLIGLMTGQHAPDDGELWFADKKYEATIIVLFVKCFF